MGGKAGQLLLFRHRGAPLHPGDDYGLADGGQGVLGVQRRRRPAKAGHAGGIIVGDSIRIQCVHLLPDGPIQAGVAGVEPHSGPSCGFHPAHHVQHLFQRHLSAVVYGTLRLRQPQQGRVDQTARVDDAVRRLQQRRTAPGDQIRCAGACAHKMYHTSLLLFLPALQQLGGGLSLAQRPGLVGKQYSPPPERPRHAAVQMQLDGLQ